MNQRQFYLLLMAVLTIAQRTTQNRPLTSLELKQMAKELADAG